MEHSQAQVAFEVVEVTVAMQKLVAGLNADRRDDAVDRAADRNAERAQSSEVPGSVDSQRCLLYTSRCV